jgi:hypothetical protein
VASALKAGPVTKPTALVSGLFMSAQSGPFHWKFEVKVPSRTLAMVAT